jgi:hypothetical protein
LIVSARGALGLARPLGAASNGPAAASRWLLQA